MRKTCSSKERPMECYSNNMNFVAKSLIKKGWRMVLQKLWVSQNFSRISRVSFFFSSYVRLAVSFFIRRCLGVSIFFKTKGLEVPIRLFVF